MCNSHSPKAQHTQRMQERRERKATHANEKLGVQEKLEVPGKMIWRCRPPTQLYFASSPTRLEGPCAPFFLSNDNLGALSKKRVSHQPPLLLASCCWDRGQQCIVSVNLHANRAHMTKVSTKQWLACNKRVGAPGASPSQLAMALKPAHSAN
jgi:hypothetical protein